MRTDGLKRSSSYNVCIIKLLLRCWRFFHRTCRYVSVQLRIIYICHAPHSHQRSILTVLIFFIVLVLLIRTSSVVLHIKPFFLYRVGPVNIQHTPCPSRFFLLKRYKLCGHETTTDTETLHCNAVSGVDNAIDELSWYCVLSLSTHSA